MEEEIWKDIPGLDGNYQVSNFGNIRSFARNKKGSLRLPHSDKDGYLLISFNIKSKSLAGHVHRFVARAFILNPESKEQVNHKDGNKRNNKVSNLEWCTRKENMQHAVSLGLMRRGKRSGRKGGKGGRGKGRRKITEDQVRLIRSLSNDNDFNKKQISKQFGISESQVYRIVTGFSWKYLMLCTEN